jgi:uncharacterized RDD family membrane protein YckC
MQPQVESPTPPAQEFFCQGCQVARDLSPPPDDPTSAFCERCGTRLRLRPKPPPYAGFWIRLVGYCVDLAIVGGILVLALGLMTVGAEAQGRDVPSRAVDVLMYGIIAPLSGVYLIGFIAAGGTPGHIVLRLRVIDKRGAPPGLRRSVVRYLVAIVSGLAFNLGYLAMLWSPHKQTWHDSIAGTYVVRSEARH